MSFTNSVLWFGKGSNTSFGKVRLKHREVFFGNDAQTASLETLEKAFTSLQRTIGWLGHPQATMLKTAMTRYFKSGVDKTQDVQAVLELTINGMRTGKLSLKTDNTSTSRFVNEFGVDRGDVPNIEGYVRNGANGSKGDIHVTRDYLMNNRFQAVRTFIHEATHRFANTDDFDEQGYMHADGSDFRQPGITAAQCLRNADSYAYFCMAMGYS
jgi:hypothetical protein